MSTFEQAVTEAAPTLGAASLRTIADRVGNSWPHNAVVSGLGTSVAEAAQPIVEALAHDPPGRAEAAGFVRGVAAGYAQHAASISVETVWSGPSSHSVPVRATAQALTQVVSEATSELLLMTYSAQPYEPLRAALESAVARGVSVTVVVETLQGAGNALAGSEPAAAFASITGVQLWHWPVAERAERHSRMHAKLAVADRRVLLVSSANLTASGVGKNIEAGMLIRGGSAPARAAEHIVELKTTGVLDRLAVSSQGGR